MLSDVYLISKVSSFDEIGNDVQEESEKKIVAELKSISSREFFAANTIAIKPEIMIKVFVYDYNNETEVRIDKERYNVYRTYRKEDYVEIYLTKLISEKKH